MAHTRHGARRPELQNGDWLGREYIENGRSLSDIAAEVGVSSPTVGRALVRHGIQVRRTGRTPNHELSDRGLLER